MLLAEQIMQTITSVLTTGLGVAANVYRGRVDPLENSQLPAVSVFQGPEVPLGDTGQANIALLDEELEVRTSLGAKANSAIIETDLNELRRLIHIILMAADPLSLAYVIDIKYAGADEPDISGETELKTGEMIVYWVVHYRHQYADAGAAP